MADATQTQCPWPTSDPELVLSVLFNGFLPAKGPPTGTFDLSSGPDSGPVTSCVDVQAASQQPVPVGNPTPLREYASSDACNAGSGTGTRLGSRTGASGTMTVSLTGLYENCGMLSDAGPVDAASGFCGPPGPVYEIQLSNVSLPSLGAVGTGNTLYPPTATVNATLYWVYTQY